MAVSDHLGLTLVQTQATREQRRRTALRRSSQTLKPANAPPTKRCRYVGTWLRFRLGAAFHLRMDGSGPGAVWGVNGGGAVVTGPQPDKMPEASRACAVHPRVHLVCVASWYAASHHGTSEPGAISRTAAPHGPAARPPRGGGTVTSPLSMRLRLSPPNLESCLNVSLLQPETAHDVADHRRRRG